MGADFLEKRHGHNRFDDEILCPHHPENIMPIYAWGSNGSGQLGIGHTDDVSIPTLHVDDSSVSEDEGALQGIVAGGNHSLLLYGSGRVVVVVGKDASGLVTAGTGLKGVKLVSATWDASCILTKSEEELITFGRGEHGELGRGVEIKEISDGSSAIDLSAIIPAGVSIIQVSSGVQHTVAVLSNGEVIGWGNGRKGQLGKSADIVWKPRRIISDILFKVKKAVCGHGFTFLVGNPESGQCMVIGQDKFGIQANAPVSVPGWKDIQASWGCIFVLFKDNRLVSWGRNDHGQLAPPNLPEIDQIAIGSEHGLALSKDGKVYAWGWGEHGNCGPDVDAFGDAREAKEIILPTNLAKIKGIGAGCATSWFWT